MNDIIHSRILHKLLKIILFINIIALLITLLISNYILIPPLKNQTLEKCSSITQSIVDQTYNSFGLIRDFTYTFVNGKNLYNAIDYYNSTANFEQRYFRLSLALTQAQSINSSIHALVLLDEKGVEITSSKFDQDDNKILESNWYKSLLQTDYSNSYSSLYKAKQFPKNRCVLAYKFILNKKIYQIFVIFNAESIIETTNFLSQNIFDNYVIIDNQNYVKYISILKYNNILNDNVLLTEIPTIIDRPAGREFEIEIPQSDWRYVGFISNDTINASYFNYLFLIFTMFLIMILLIFILLIPSISHVIKPLNKLAKTMNRIAEGDYSVRSNIVSRDEVGDLSRIFNDTLDSLVAQMNVLVEKEKIEQKMKFGLLISQIDPHFIYNTMSKINSLARMKKTDKIVSINTALINILRDTLRLEDFDVFDKIEHEISILKQYILIINNCYQTEINVIWDIDESTKGIKIPKKIIQPLVENAIFYGLANEYNNKISGEIRITIKQIDKQIIISVFNTGRTIDQIKLKEMNSAQFMNEERGHHIGISNIRQRINYLYSNCSSIHFVSEEGIGTTVTITLESSKE